MDDRGGPDKRERRLSDGQRRSGLSQSRIPENDRTVVFNQSTDSFDAPVLTGDLALTDASAITSAPAITGASTITGASVLKGALDTGMCFGI